MNLSEQGSGDNMELKELGSRAKLASQEIALLTHETRNQLLAQIIEELANQQDLILEANQRDLLKGRAMGLNEGLLDRLMLNEKRIQDICLAIKEVTKLADPLNVVLEEKDLANTLHLRKISVPLGVVGMIYESRPNVTIDAACLCLKSGNAVILRGGKEAIETNKQLVVCLKSALKYLGINEDGVNLIEDLAHERVNEMMRMNDVFDVLIPRGGKRLIDQIVNNSSVPVIQTGTGNNSIYVDKSANLEKSLAIIENAKCQRISVCNAMENLLVHEAVAKEFLEALVERLSGYSIAYCGDSRAVELIEGCSLASEEELANEFLDYKLAVIIVKDLDEALAFINQYGSKHSEAILAEEGAVIEKYLNCVDASALYVNASTRFSDGFEFGLGCEIGISTQKLHARGPMGLNALTTIKYLIEGTYTVRP